MSTEGYHVLHLHGESHAIFQGYDMYPSGGLIYLLTVAHAGTVEQWIEAFEKGEPTNIYEDTLADTILGHDCQWDYDPNAEPSPYSETTYTLDLDTWQVVYKLADETFVHDMNEPVTEATLRKLARMQCHYECLIPEGEELERAFGEMTRAWRRANNLPVEG